LQYYQLDCITGEKTILIGTIKLTILNMYLLMNRFKFTKLSILMKLF